MSPQSAPSLVSVVIPCYNQGRFLGDAVESVLRQSYQPVEVVVVNDGSTDNTSEVASRYPAIRYVGGANQGVAEARNTGFRASTGDYVQFLDADDRLTQDSISAHLRCFAENPEAGFVAGDIELIDVTGGRVIPLRRKAALLKNHYEQLLKANCITNTIAVLFRRGVLDQVGGFRGFFSPAEDYELLLRAARAFPGANHSAIVAQYRRRATNASRQGAIMLRAMHRVMVSQRQAVQGNQRRQAALRQGERYWRDWFGAVTIKEIYAHVGRGNFKRAISALVVLLRYVRGRVFVLPWKYRRRLRAAIAARVRTLGARLRGVLPPP